MDDEIDMGVALADLIKYRNHFLGLGHVGAVLLGIARYSDDPRTGCFKTSF